VHSISHILAAMIAADRLREAGGARLARATRTSALRRRPPVLRAAPPPLARSVNDDGFAGERSRRAPVTDKLCAALAGGA